MFTYIRCASNTLRKLLVVLYTFKLWSPNSIGMVDYLRSHFLWRCLWDKYLFSVVKTNKLSIGLLQNIGLNVPKEIQFFLIKRMLCQNNNLSSVKSEDSNLVEHHTPLERRKLQTNINWPKQISISKNALLRDGFTILSIGWTLWHV